MTRCVLLVMALGMLLAEASQSFAADDAKDEAVKKEMKKLEGTWQLVSFENNGKPLAAEKVKQIRLTIEGNKYTAMIGDQKVELTFTVDPGQKPRTIDFTQVRGGDKTVTQGIYELTDDTLRLCRPTEAGKKRPTEFATKEDSGTVLAVYKREKK